MFQGITPMKPAGLILLLSAGSLVIDLAAASNPGQVTSQTKAHIREGLPTYQPPPSPGEGDGVLLAQTTDPSVLILPKLTVEEKRLPKDAADRLMSKRDFNRKMENLYLDTVAAAGRLNVVLNSLTIPFLSPSQAARGRAIYRAGEQQRLDHVNEVSKSIDPEAAQKYRQELDNSHTTRSPIVPIRH